jgi:hypothetical protein
MPTLISSVVLVPVDGAGFLRTKMIKRPLRRDYAALGIRAFLI